MAAWDGVVMNSVVITNTCWLCMRCRADEYKAEQPLRGIRPLAANGRTGYSPMG